MIEGIANAVADLPVDPTKTALRVLQSELKKLYGEKTPRILVYGSYARDEAEPESDIDVLLLYTEEIHPGVEIRRLSSILADLNLRYQVLISIVPASEKQYRYARGSFWKNVRREGFLLTDFEPLLEKADRFIQSASLLAAEGDFDSAASRLYYAMFFTASALLESLDLTSSSHRATISAFGQRFTKTGELDSRFHKALLDAFSKRQLGDYAPVSGLRCGDIDVLMKDAIDFMAVGRDLLEKSKPENH